ncbi:MAG TPA: hypothetical protein VMT20_13020 [Terriglobia bacterium]|nr:hypothetical protein [Terriglobia bacterium]
MFSQNSNPTERRRVRQMALGLSLVALFLAPLSAAAQDTTYTFETLIYPGDTFTQTLGINVSGTIAGYHGANINKGFTLVPPHSFTLENFPNSAQTQVIGINSAGWTDGFYIDQQGNTHGFIKEASALNSAFRTVTYPGTTFNQLLGLNDENQAAGYYADAAGNDHPYVYDENGGVFLLINIPGSVSAQATGINNRGEVSGFYIDSAGVNPAVSECTSFRIDFVPFGGRF